MRKNRNACYCAFCRTERTVYRKKHLSIADTLLNVLAGLLVMVLVFQDFDPRFLLFVGVFLIISEFFVHLRWRLAITCAKCGFDPVLYKRNPHAAAAKVKLYMAERANDPFWALSPPKLPVVYKKKSIENALRKDT